MMEISNLSSFAELGLMDIDQSNFFHQWPLVSIPDPGSVSFGSPFFREEHHQHHPISLHPIPDHEGAPESSTQHESNKPLKLIMMRSSTSSSSTNFHFIDDANPEGFSRPKTESWTLDFPSECVVSESAFANKNHVVKPACQGAKRVSSSNTRPKDNVLAERKRREKLTQRFIDLSAIVPGLKKMDKASILGDAIKYTKQLQERMKILEHQTKKKTIESVVFVKKHLHECSEINSSSEPLPEIEARFLDDHVLINIQCEKRNGLLEKTVAKIEKLHLSVVSCSAMTFGDSARHIVVMAKKDEESNTNMKELVQSLCTSLKTHLK
ncbi:transcription factor bHLH25-like isoform X2 [Henckelia pumila]|uniref:transcription factor bHLH25-like isoform X2 n=1 Tax=Henckelia pumila TaxID=405737 RepID=UPI003C6E2A1F